MPAYKKIYLKDESFDPIFKTANKSFYFKSRILPGLLMAFGFLILGTQVVYPLVYFKTHDETINGPSRSVLGVATGFTDFEFKELHSVKEPETKTTEIPKYFYISIPKLNITKAEVETNAPSLNPEKALGHYKGSGLPGSVGNAFIYGHSVLPWFYNPKNYKTIFSTLDQLETGDPVYIYYNDKEYEYAVETKEIFESDKINPLAEYKPRYLNESTISLMTCWPAGTRAKRLLVQAVAR